MKSNKYLCFASKTIFLLNYENKVFLYCNHPEQKYR